MVQNELPRMMPSVFSPLTTEGIKMTSLKKKNLAFTWLTFMKRWNDTQLQWLCDDWLVFRSAPANTQTSLTGHAFSW